MANAAPMEFHMHFADYSSIWYSLVLTDRRKSPKILPSKIMSRGKWIFRVPDALYAATLLLALLLLHVPLRGVSRHLNIYYWHIPTALAVACTDNQHTTVDYATAYYNQDMYTICHRNIHCFYYYWSPSFAYYYWSPSFASSLSRARPSSVRI